MDIDKVIEQLRKEADEYIKSNKAAIGWLVIPEHLLRELLVKCNNKIEDALLHEWMGSAFDNWSSDL